MSLELVRNYYGQVLTSSADLKTSACCTPGDMPPAARRALANLHEEILARYYGCGLVMPDALEGARVLDLGCGAGRDVYLLAQLVGPNGHVAGVDATHEQLAVARRHEHAQAERFGFAKPNTSFLDGEIEKLDLLNLAPTSFDIVVSNCVINLARDKEIGSRRGAPPVEAGR